MTRTSQRRRLWIGGAAVVALGIGLAGLARHGEATSRSRVAGPAAEIPTPPGATYRSDTPAADRRAFFGELHLHTAYSFDAWPLGVRTTPDQAYRFGRGEPIEVMGVEARRAWPLDFMAVTEHAEWMGVFNQLDDPAGGFAGSDLGRQILARPGAALRYLAGLPAQPTTKAAMLSAWDMEVKAANDNDRPGRFTTFIAYEWTSMNQGKYNLHRNVFFNSDHAPPPFTSVQSGRPEDLWTYLEDVRAHGVDAIAIPHNGNVSGGLMYDWNDSDGRPIDRVYAQRRALNEPLTEIIQGKGQSDTIPELSPNDEFANYEVYDRLLTNSGEKSAPNGSYIRQAFGRGLVIQSKVGVNPFKYGVVGGSDIHNGLSVSTQGAFFGGPFGADARTMTPDPARARRILGEPADPSAPTAPASGRPQLPVIPNSLTFRPGGVTGVWAESNTRNAIFAALKRKETWATSGTRIRVRFFGGWDFKPALLRQAGWVADAYAHGVSMGGDLPDEPAAARAPTFIVWALKDPDGAALDRIQIIKVWLAGGDYKERVFDVALSNGRIAGRAGDEAPPLANAVDMTTGKPRPGVGAAQLQAVWRDPSFDPSVPAVYYARVLEAPSARWSTLLAIRDKLPLPKDAPAAIQERAWASPIWFTPPAARR